MTYHRVSGILAQLPVDIPFCNYPAPVFRNISIVTVKKYDYPKSCLIVLPVMVCTTAYLKKYFKSIIEKYII